VQSQVALIPTIGNYIQDGGGKRIRPAVLLMAARMAGYTGEAAVLYASVIEFIHTATLVHDDIIDESELRRGREAVHTRWGNHVTVLFGDFLYPEVDVAGAHAGSARDHPPPLRRHPAHRRRRDLPADERTATSI
jgi:octaprenyl-diphosphate synthase